MKFIIVFFIGAIAFANAAVIVQEHHVVDVPLEKTSIVGPSGTITQEKSVPFVETKVHEVVPSVKVVEPSTVLTEVVPEVKSAVNVVHEVPYGKVDTVAPVVHQVGTPFDVPVFKNVVTGVPEYPVFPAWYSFPWFRSYYPYYPNYFV
ncbi:hypothetical protein WA026_017888 [Henosepilachna vigintioctopunctata]|uniref:Uncharacterized protein n=1 Tax=Henosepilachna vigintioctopunctata TaxID=420089 RepID=A0AAW1TV06_9CUCU